MHNVMSVDDVIAKIRSGEHPAAVVEQAAGPVGPDRHDIASREEFLAGYNAIVQDVASYGGRITVDWPSQVADALVSGDPQRRADLIATAQQNRDEYSKNGANYSDAGGSYQMWDDILRGLLATRTDQLAPPAQPMQ